MTALQNRPPASASAFSPGASARRIAAMVLRQLYLLRSSWPRVFELMYWPTIQMTLWGFITLFLATNSSYIAEAAGVLISAFWPKNKKKFEEAARRPLEED